MPGDSPLSEHDVLPIGGEMNTFDDTRSARAHDPLLHGDTSSHVEADQSEDRWVCIEPGVSRAIHLGHSPGPQDREDLVRTQPAAWSQTHASKVLPASRPSESG